MLFSFIMNKEKQQIQQTKLQNNYWSAKECTQSIEMYTPVSLCTAWKAWHKSYSQAHSLKWQSFHVLISCTFFFNIDCCFASTCIYEVLHHNGIFRVSGAKALPRCLEHTGPVLSKSLHTMAKVTEQQHGWVIIHESKTAEISCLCTAEISCLCSLRNEMERTVDSISFRKLQ